MRTEKSKTTETAMTADPLLVAGFIDDNILDKAIEIRGVEAQLEMVIEECMELALALQKRKRGDSNQKIANVVDEIADVKIIIRLAEKIFGSNPVNERVDFKMNRLTEILSEGLS